MLTPYRGDGASRGLHLGASVVVKHVAYSGIREGEELDRVRSVDGIARLVPRVLHASERMLILERMPGVPVDSSADLLLNAAIAFDAGAKLRLIHGVSTPDLSKDVRVHGDFAPSNLLCVDDAISAVLDPAPNGYWTTAFGSRRPAGEETANYVFSASWRLHRRRLPVTAAEWRAMVDAFHAGYDVQPDRSVVAQLLNAHAEHYLRWRLPVGVRELARRRWQSWLRQVSG